MSQGNLIVSVLVVAFLIFITARTDANGTPELVNYVRLIV